MESKLYFPFKPYLITQHWGNPNPTYRAAGMHFDLHNGVDAVTGKYDWEGKIITEFLVWCPVGNFVVSKIAYYPDGGGNQIELTSKTAVIVGGVECYLRLIMCHAKKILVSEGYEPKLGELLMIADNTGFSTGLHTHLGVYRFHKNAYGNEFFDIDKNDANGSYSPELLYTGMYSVDLALPATLVLSGLRYLKYRMTV